MPWFLGGDAVVYVNPNDDEQIREALMRVLGDDALCQDLSIRGLKRSQIFSWERCAQKTIEAYRQIA